MAKLKILEELHLATNSRKLTCGEYFFGISETDYVLPELSQKSLRFSVETEMSVWFYAHLDFAGKSHV